MSEDNLRIGGPSSGLAVLLNGEESKEKSSKTRLVSSCEDFSHQSVERTLECVFGLPNKSLGPLTSPLNANFIQSVIKNNLSGIAGSLDSTNVARDGVRITGNSHGPNVVDLEKSSICGKIVLGKNHHLLIESSAMFSSARANACVWKGKWMYEVLLETSGIMQLGWASLSCPFTDHRGVGDSNDSYAYDGRRVSKWNKDAEAYGQSWVVGDVIGCCIDLDCDEIIFYRNGISLGVAFHGIRYMGPGFGYYPAISLSQGERCELNFGGRPFKYPIEGFLPLQAPPSKNSFVIELLRCWSRFLGMNYMEQAEQPLLEKLRRLKRFVSVEELFHPISRAICEELFVAIDADLRSREYIIWGPVLSFMMDLFGSQPTHNYSSLDKVIDVFLEFQGSNLLFEHIIYALSWGCKTASLVLTDCPYTGSYAYLALVCHLLRRQELMVLWWKSSDFELLFEGFLSQKSPNKQDLEYLMPTISWPGSSEDVCYESSMMLTATALSEAVSKVEEKHRDLCRLVIQFIPPTTPLQLPGAIFRTFLHNLLLKNRGADRNVPPPGVSSNSVLVSLYTVILHFLSEGFGLGDTYCWLTSCKVDRPDIGFLHRGGQKSFPVGLFLRDDTHRNDISRLGGSYNHLSKVHPDDDVEAEVIRWEEGCMDDEETRITHTTRQKPCCCSTYDTDFTRMSKRPIRYTSKGSRGHCSSIPDRSSHVSAECSAGGLNEELVDKPSSSDQTETEYTFRPTHHLKAVPKENSLSSDMLREEELLDALLWLYHVGLAPNFKQALYYMAHQSQSITLLEETDRQIRERGCTEHLKRLKEARNEYREEVIDCVRHCTWYRISLFSRWKQRGMYATCMWVVQMLLVLSKVDSVFIYVPEFYLEALVDCFHVLRKSDPPFVPSTIFIKQGLTSFVTFVVAHFNDPRISSADLKDLLLQSISVLVQYKDYLAAFESNKAATQLMPKALLSAFDNRSWIPVTNILLRLCKGSGFGSSKHGESSSSSSILFQKLLKEACINDEGLFSVFLNRLFNTLSWAMTEFSVSVREMQEKYQVLEFQQRKCSVIFDLSCNLARILEFCTLEVPQAFLSGTDTNLRRLTELIVFILNNITSSADAEFFDLSRRRHGLAPEKVNRAMILAPLVGIVLNLLEASKKGQCREENDVIGVFASMDCPDTVHFGFQYLLDYNWEGANPVDQIRCSARKFSSEPALEQNELDHVVVADMFSKRTDIDGIDKEMELNNISVTHDLVLKVLKKFESSPDLAKRFFQWVSESNGDRLSSKSYNMMLWILGINASDKEFWDLIDVMKKKGYGVPKYVRDKVMERFENNGMSDDLERLRMVFASGSTDSSAEKMSSRVCKIIKNELWSDDVEKQIIDLKISFSSDIVSMTVEGLGTEPAKALIFFRWLEECGLFKHDERNYNAIARVLGREDSIDRFWKVLEEMRSKGFEMEQETFVKVLGRFSKRKMIAEAVDLYEFAMLGANKPSAQCFTFLMKKVAVSKQLDLDLVSRIIRIHKENGNALTYSTMDSVLKSLSSVGRIGECDKLLKAIEEGGFVADASLKCKVATALISAGKKEAAKAVINSIEAPGSDHMTIIAAHCISSNLDEAVDSFKKMIEQEGFVSAGYAFESIMDAYCRNNKEVEACRVLCDLANREQFKPWHSTYKLLINKLSTQCGFKEALNLLGLMRDHGFPPHIDPIIRYVAESGTADDAYLLLKKMTSKKFPSTTVFLRVFEALVKRGRKSEAQNLLSKCPGHIRDHADVLNLLASLKSNQVVSSALAS